MVTDPRMGVWQALKLKPSAIFLLSDGEFNGRQYNIEGIPGNPPVERIIDRYLKNSIPIHTIALEDIVNRRRLRNIATLTAGSHQFIGSQSNEDLLLQDLASEHYADTDYALDSIIETPAVLTDSGQLQRVVRRLSGMIKSRQSVQREKAHQALLALADGLEIDVTEVESVVHIPTPTESRFVHNTWNSIWRRYFRAADTKLTQLAIP